MGRSEAGDSDEPNGPIGAPHIDLSRGIMDGDGDADPYWTTLALAGSSYVALAAGIRLFCANLLYRALYFLVLAGGGLLIWSSTALPAGGIWQQVQASISIGVFTFLLTAIIVTASHSIGVGAHVVVLVLLALALYVALTSDGLFQSYAVNVAAALVLCLSLDLTFRRLESGVLKIVAAARRNRDAIDEAVDEAELAVAPQHYAVGGGTIDEASDRQ